MPEPDRRFSPDEGPFTYQQDLDLIRSVVRDAGALAMDWYEKGARCWDKSPDNPVTEADIGVNKFIFQKLLNARPAYGWVSEEGGGDLKSRNRRRVFMVDPIDGTRAFIQREPAFTVCIARLDANIPVVGAVYNPATDELFEAVRGGGAKLNGEPIQASSKSDLSKVRMISSLSPSVRNRDWRDAEFADPTPNSVAYRLCLIAAGRWDGAVALDPKADWDLAAASLILEEAGGVCSDRDSKPFQFNQPELQNRSVVASGALLHGLLIDRLRNLETQDTAIEGASGVQDIVAPKAQTGSVDTDKVTTQARHMSNDTPKAQEQLLHIVFGGELKDVSNTVFEDLTQIDFVGAYPSYAAAYDAWKAAAQRTVDNAHMRYFILHAHRLLDPETGRTVDV